jgi:hypothetical protein
MRDLARELFAPLDARRRAAALARTARRPGRIVVGPWHSEIGFELLYWIPMLRHALEAAGVGPERVTAVSRGGVASWYEGIAGEYVDLLDHVSVDELRALHSEREKAFGVQKQLGPLKSEEQLLERMVPGYRESATLIHPSAMYRLFHFFFGPAQPISIVERNTMHRPIVSPEHEPVPLDDQPAEYVAVKAYFSSCFPDNPANREFVTDLVKRIAEEREVVLLDTGLRLDDHDDFHLDRPNVHSLRDSLPPERNLAIQTQMIAGADALVSTYGGFSYLGPYLGVPSLCFYSDDNFNHGHLDVMRRAGRELADVGAGAPFVPLRTGEVDPVAALGRAIGGAG